MSQLPRSSVEAPFQGYPAYGALHEILPDTRLREFLAKFSEISNAVIKPPEELPPSELIDPTPDFEPEDDFGVVSLGPESEAKVFDPPFDQRHYYRIFDPEKMGVTVVEMLPSQRAASAMRKVFEGQDFGAVEQEARDTIDQGNPVLYPQLKFTSVIGVGKMLHTNGGVTPVRQKLALLADVTTHLETHDMLDKENAAICDALRRRLKQFVLPNDFIKHLTFAALKRPITNEMLAEIITQTNSHLTENPLYVDLDRQWVVRLSSKRGGRR